jgi:hypothetical protein
MCLAITKGQKMFELLTHRKPSFSPGTRLVGGPSGNKPGQWPVWFVAEVSGVVTVDSDVLEWLLAAGLLTHMVAGDITHLSAFIQNRIAAGENVLHVVLFERVHDVTTLHINLRGDAWPNNLPHPRASSLLAYLKPALYWHNAVEHWLQSAPPCIYLARRLSWDPPNADTSPSSPPSRRPAPHLAPPTDTPSEYQGKCISLRSVIQTYMKDARWTDAEEHDNCTFLLTVYSAPGRPRSTPCTDFLLSLAARLTDPDGWKQKWPNPVTYTDDRELGDLKDHTAAVAITLRILWAWMAQDVNMQEARTLDAARHFLAQEPVEVDPDTWLTPRSHSAYRCILLTHIIMATSLYGWARERLNGVRTLCGPTAAMLEVTGTLLNNTDPEGKIKWIARRLECVGELTYIYLLQRQMDLHSRAQWILLDPTATFIVQTIAKLHCEGTPGYLPANTLLPIKAHHCAVALQLLSAVPATWTSPNNAPHPP